MNALLLVGAGGFVGSIARYLISTNLMKMSTSGFPIGTLMVNVVGCFGIGLLAAKSDALNHDTRLLLMTGLLGGFTTFSAFGLETITLMKKGEWLFASTNIALSVVLGLAAVWLGMLVMGQRV